ncbi:MAG: hypothetical protein ACRD3D_01050 [Terriglobia bacterium]
MPNPIQVNGAIQDARGGQRANTSVFFSLQNYGSGLPVVAGTSIVVPSEVSAVSASDGTFTVELWGNDNITPGYSQSPPQTYYLVQVDGQPLPLGMYSITGSGPINLNSATPLSSVPGVVPPQTYTNQLGVNGTPWDAYLRKLQGGAIVYADQCTGTDMAAKINAAIGLLPAAGGTVDARGFTGAQTWTSNPFNAVTKAVCLLLGSVTTTVSTTTFIPSNCSIEGQGAGNTVLLSTPGSNIAVLDAEYVSNVAIRKLEINGNGATSGLTIQLKGVINGRVEDCYLHNASGSNIGVDTNGPSSNSAQILIANNILGPSANPVVANIQTGDGATDVTIEGNHIYETLSGQIMIGIDGGHRHIVTGNYLEGTSAVSAGVQVEATSQNADDVIISDNILMNIGGADAGAIRLTETGGHTLQGMSVTGNILRTCGRGITVDDYNGNGSGTVKNVIIANNFYDAGAAASKAGIQLWNHQGSTFSDVSIDGNTIASFGAASGNGGIIIQVDTGTISNVRVNGNGVTGGPTGTYGLYLTGTISHLAVQGNDFTGNPAGPINATSQITGLLNVDGNLKASTVSSFYETVAVSANPTTLNITLPIDAICLVSAIWYATATGGTYAQQGATFLATTFSGYPATVYATYVATLMSGGYRNVLATSISATGAVNNVIAVQFSGATDGSTAYVYVVQLASLGAAY